MAQEIPHDNRSQPESPSHTTNTPSSDLLTSTDIDAKITLIGQIAWVKQAKKYKDALEMCRVAAQADSKQKAHRLQVQKRIFEGVSYINNGWVAAVTFPKDIAPYPILLQNATPKQIENTLSLEVENGVDQFVGSQFITHEKLWSDAFYGKVDFYTQDALLKADPELVARYVMNDLVFDDLMKFVGKTDTHNEYSWYIYAELLWLSFAWTRTDRGAPVLQYELATHWLSWNVAAERYDENEVEQKYSYAATILRPKIDGKTDSKKWSLQRVRVGNSEARPVRLYGEW